MYETNLQTEKGRQALHVQHWTMSDELLQPTRLQASVAHIITRRDNM
jgi:hypothetical protein